MVEDCIDSRLDEEEYLTFEDFLEEIMGPEAAGRVPDYGILPQDNYLEQLEQQRREELNKMITPRIP